MPAREWARAPRYISIALTNACDLRCTYCYAPKRAARLDTEVLKGWLLELDANDCLGVGFGGGEPTLHPDFAALCCFAAIETGLAVTFTTHAHHLSDGLLQQLHGHVHFVRVSMDGVGRTYEELRGRPFHDLLFRLRAIRRVARFGINVVVNARTLPDLDAVAACAADCGADEILLLPERPTAAGRGADVDTLTRLAAWVECYAGCVPLAISESAAPTLPLFTPVPGETGMRAYAHVDASGVLKATSFDPHGIRIGDAGLIAAFSNLNRQTAQGPT